MEMEIIKDLNTISAMMKIFMVIKMNRVILIVIEMIMIKIINIKIKVKKLLKIVLR